MSNIMESSWINSNASPSSIQTTAQPGVDLVSLERRSLELHGQLQILLDAQAKNLTVGRDVPTTVEQVNNTPSVIYRTSSPRKIIPIRQPVEDPITLRAARRGIKRAMHELCAIKQEKLQIICAHLHEVRQELGRVDGWEKKQVNLSAEIRLIEEGITGTRVQRLKEHDGTLQEEITRTEIHLLELKSRHKSVQLELSTLNNSVQSELSSYQAAQQLLDGQIREFLARSKEQPRGLDVGVTYLSLPLDRRTLAMAHQYTKRIESDLEKQREDTEDEKLALEEGIHMWGEVVRRLTDLEDDSVKCLALIGSPAVWPMSDSKEESTRHRNNILTLRATFDQAQVDLESMFKIAESHGWNLLLCSIGAELEALVRGQEVLCATFPILTEEHLHNHDGDRDLTSIIGPNLPHDREICTSKIDATDRRFQDCLRRYPSLTTDDLEPDILFS